MSQPAASSDLRAVMEGMLDELAGAFAAHRGEPESDGDRHLAVVAVHTLGEWALRGGNPALAIARIATRTVNLDDVIDALRRAGGRDGAHGSVPALHAAADWLEHGGLAGGFLHADGESAPPWTT